MHAAALQEPSGQQDSPPCTTPLERIQARGNTLPCQKKKKKSQKRICSTTSGQLLGRPIFEKNGLCYELTKSKHRTGENNHFALLTYIWTVELTQANSTQAYRLELGPRSRIRFNGDF